MEPMRVPTKQAPSTCSPQWTQQASCSQWMSRGSGSSVIPQSLPHGGGPQRQSTRTGLQTSVVHSSGLAQGAAHPRPAVVAASSSSLPLAAVRGGEVQRVVQANAGSPVNTPHWAGKQGLPQRSAHITESQHLLRGSPSGMLGAATERAAPAAVQRCTPQGSAPVHLGVARSSPRSGALHTAGSMQAIPRCTLSQDCETPKGPPQQPVVWPAQPVQGAAVQSTSPFSTQSCSHLDECRSPAPNPGQYWAVLPPLRTWVVALPSGATRSPSGSCIMTPRSVSHLANSSRAAFSPVTMKRAGLRLMGLPAELQQCLMDWLPTFTDRVRMSLVCKAASGLEWRLAPPLRPDEEMSSYGLGDLGAAAVALALAVPGRNVIRELALGNNDIGDAGAEAVAQMLEGTSQLRRLSLRDNAIGDRGAKALAAALAVNSKLEELDIWGNQLSRAGKLALLSASRCKIFIELDSVPRTLVSSSSKEASLLGTMRAVLFDWISQVHNSSSAPTALNGDSDPQEMLFRTFGHVDAYLSLRRIPHMELQLIGVACTLAAALVHGSDDSEESAGELASWLAFVTDGACTEREVRAKAVEVQKVLGFRLHQPTAYTFLRRYLRKTGWTEESFSMANYLIELAAINAEFLAYRPQTLAAAAAVLSRQYLTQGIGIQHVPGWKARLLRCSQADVHEELAPCTAALARMHAYEYGRRDKFVNVKYEWARLHGVAKINPNTPPDAEFFVNYMLQEQSPVGC